MYFCLCSALKALFVLPPCVAERIPIYNIPVGQPLEQSPGYSLLLPMQQVDDITITQAPVTWKVQLRTCNSTAGSG
jgi:hypothetical protein